MQWKLWTLKAHAEDKELIKSESMSTPITVIYDSDMHPQEMMNNDMNTM